MILIRILCIAGAGLLAACSNYQSRWNAARTAKSGDFEGAYEGCWSSGRMKGADGKLRCILKKAGPAEYAADFRATWHGVFASEHTARLVVTSRAKRKGRSGVVDVVQFRGGARIEMWIGSGSYRCEGRLVSGIVSVCGEQRTTAIKPVILVPASLHATYDAAYDSGLFELTKAGPR